MGAMTDRKDIISAFDLPGARKLNRRSSYPSFPPSIVNSETLSKAEAGRQELVFSRRVAILPDAVVVRLKNAVVFGNGCVMTEDGHLVSETMRDFGQPMPSPPSRIIDRTVALLRKPGDANYGHWLIECVPRIFEYRKMFPSLDMGFGISAGPANMKQIRRDSLSWCGVGEDEQVNLNADPALIHDLLLVSGNSIHSHTHDFDGLLSLATLAKTKGSHGTGLSRLYVKRPEGSRRRVLNEDAVLDVLGLYGFCVVAPETMSANEQVELFSGAGVVIGVSGAALTNTIFCNPRTKVLTLMPNRGEEYFFWDIANVAGLEFSIMFGVMNGEDLGCHSDFSIDTAVLKKWLDTALVS